jgi:hypothetical protein
MFRLCASLSLAQHGAPTLQFSPTEGSTMSNRCFRLTAINLRLEERWLTDLRNNRATTSFREVDFVEDDLERPIPQAEEAPAPDSGVDLSNPPAGVYEPVLVFENDIREVYARRGGRFGTRIVYRSGAARPVKESFAEVSAMLAAAGIVVGPEGTG